MRSSTLKNINNKQLKLIFKEIIKELGKRFPEFVN